MPHFSSWSSTFIASGCLTGLKPKYPQLLVVGRKPFDSSHGKHQEIHKIKLREIKNKKQIWNTCNNKKDVNDKKNEKTNLPISMQWWKSSHCARK